MATKKRVARYCAECGCRMTRHSMREIHCSVHCRIKASRVSVLQTKSCELCGRKFQSRLSTQRFCSVACRKKASINERGLRSFDGVKLTTGTSGAIRELIVCTDLMLRGFPTFRAISASCPCDLIVLAGEKILRVEVTCGYMRRDGSIGWPAHDTSTYDVIAIVMTDHSIHYVPNVFDVAYQSTMVSDMSD